LSSRADRDSIHVDAEGVRRLTFVKTNPWLRATFPAQIEDGVLDVTFTPRTGDAPADLGRWSLKSMRVVSRSAVVPPGPPADGGIVYGWQPETTGAQSRIMFTVRYLSDHHCSSAKDRLFGDCVSATYDWGPDDITFNADLPNGRYDVECHVIQVYGGTPLILDAFAEGVPQVQKLALKDRPGGSWGPSRKIPMKAEVADGQLNLRFVISDEASKSKSYMWGIQAVIVRPAAR
jgi:hypothetical protein